MAFSGLLDTGERGIFTGSGGPTTTIADTSGPFDSCYLDDPSLNNSGTVAFVAILDTGEQGIFTGSGGPTTTIADNSGPFDFLWCSPSLNDSGTVAFVAILDTGETGIFTGSGGPTTTIADNSGPFSLRLAAPLSTTAARWRSAASWTRVRSASSPAAAGPSRPSSTAADHSDFLRQPLSQRQRHGGVHRAAWTRVRQASSPDPIRWRMK